MTSRPSSHRDTTAPTPSALILVALGLTVAMQLVGRFFPSYATWGFNFWAELPDAFAYASAVLFIVVTIPAVSRALYDLFASVEQSLGSVLSWIPRILQYALAVPLIFVATLLLRSRVLVYGDGYIAVANTASPLSHSFTGIHEYLKPLSVIIYRIGYVMLHDQLHFSLELSFAIVSALGGAVGIVALVRLAIAMTSSRSQRIWLVSAGFTSGCIMLFFGHVELYVWGAAFFLLFLGNAYRFQKGQSGMGLLLLFGLLMTGFNAMLLPAGLAVLVFIGLHHRTARHRAKLAPNSTILSLILLAALGSIVSAAVMQFGLKHYGTTPFIATVDNPYAALSLTHILDMANILMYAAPVGVWFLIAALVQRRVKFAEHGILVLAAAMTLIVAFWIDSEIGAPRDWDLLSFFGFPLTLLGAALAMPSKEDSSQFRSLTVPLVVTAVILVIPQIYVHLKTEVGVNRIDRLIWQDPHYQPRYEKAKRGIAWGALLQDNARRVDLAEKYVIRRIQAEPNDDLAWFNLGQVAYERKDFRNAAAAHARAFKIDSADDRYRLYYAASLQELGRHDQVRSLLSGTSASLITDVRLARTLGIILAKEEMFHEAADAFRRVLVLVEPECSDYTNLGLAYFWGGVGDSAITYFTLASRTCPNEKRCEILKALLLAQIGMKYYAAAQATLDDYARACPATPEIDSLRQQVRAMR